MRTAGGVTSGRALSKWDYQVYFRDSDVIKLYSCLVTTQKVDISMIILGMKARYILWFSSFITILWVFNRYLIRSRSSYNFER